MNGRRLLRRPRIALALALLLVAGFAGPARADDDAPAAFDRRGIYLGGGMRLDQIGGVLDGESYAYGEQFFAVIPKVDPGGTFEISLASLATYGGLVATYSGGRHDAEWLGDAFTARVSDIDFDFRVSAYPRSPVQPHAIVGFGFKRLAVDDAAVTPAGVDDAVFRGFSWDLGLGASVALLPQLLLDVSAIRAFRTYRNIASGSDEALSFRGSLDAQGWSVRAGLLFRLATLAPQRARPDEPF